MSPHGKDLSKIKSNTVLPNADYNISPWTENSKEGKFKVQSSEQSNTYGLSYGDILYSEYPLYIKCKSYLSEISKNQIVQLEIENYGIDNVTNLKIRFKDKNNYFDSKPFSKELGFIRPEQKKNLTINMSGSNIKELELEIVK